MVQWLRTHLPVQGTGVQSPVREDSTAVWRLSPRATPAEARELQGLCATAKEAMAISQHAATRE